MKSEPKAFASLSSGLLARKGAARPAMRPQGFTGGGNGLDDLGWNDMGHDAPRPALVPVEGDHPHVSRNPLSGLTPISPVHDQQAEIEQRFTAYDADEDYEEGEEEEVASASFASLAATVSPPTDEFVDEDQPLELHSEIGSDKDGDDKEGELPEAMPSAPEVDAYAPLVPFASVTRSAEPDLEPEPQPVIETYVPAVQVAAPAPVHIPAHAPKPVRQPSVRTEVSAKGKAAFTLRLDPARHLKLRLACAVTGKSAQQLVTQALDELLASMPELDAMAERAPAERTSRKG